MVGSVAQPRVTTFRKKARRANFSALISYTAIVALIISIVSVGYQAPVEETQAGGLSRASIAVAKPSVDQVAAASIAASAAQTADLAVANNVTNLSISLAAKSELAQVDDTLLSKPQIVQSENGPHGIKVYTAVQGDAVPAIAARFGVSEDTIRWSNKLQSDALQAGKQLEIPSVTGLVYTVRDGDDAAKIAEKYKADKDRIITYNDAELTGLKPGQKIIIPGGILPENERPGYVNRSSGRVASGGTTGFPRATDFAGNRYSYGYCTWYAYNRRAELGRPVGSFWGNAVTWASYARAAGYLVNNVPAVGAVLQTGGYGGYGHVAVVERVDAEGNVTVSEMNYVGWNVTSTRTIPASQARAYTYIH